MAFETRNELDRKLYDVVRLAKRGTGEYINDLIARLFQPITQSVGVNVRVSSVRRLSQQHYYMDDQEDADAETMYFDFFFFS